MRRLVALALLALAPTAAAAAVGLDAPLAVGHGDLPPVEAAALRSEAPVARVAAGQDRVALQDRSTWVVSVAAETPRVELVEGVALAPRALIVRNEQAPTGDARIETGSRASAPWLVRKVDPGLDPGRRLPPPPAFARDPVAVAASDPATPTPSSAPVPPEPPVAASTAATGVRPPASWGSAATFAGAAALAILAPFALYHRVRGARTLDQETRQRVFTHVRVNAGAAPADIARVLGLDPKTVHYHLSRLAKEGFIVPDGPPRRVRYFASGAIPPAKRPALVAATASRAVLDAILAAPGSSKTQLAARLGLARPTVSWHLKRLLAAGVIRIERDGREARVVAVATEALNSQPL